MISKSKRTILCIPDTQAPFQHPNTLEFLDCLAQAFPPDVIVHLGDEIDAHALSKYPKDPDGMGAGLEHIRSLEFLEEMWTLFPKMYMCTSNHTVRPWKKAYESGIPKAFLKSYAEALGAPETVAWADRWIIDGICFEHGEGLSGKNAALTAAEHNRMSTVIGHQHSYPGIVYSVAFNTMIYGFNTGCLIDESAYAFRYGTKIRKKPGLGAGVIIHGVPFWIPMFLRADKKWNSKKQESFLRTMLKTAVNQ